MSNVGCSLAVAAQSVVGATGLGGVVVTMACPVVTLGAARLGLGLFGLGGVYGL